MKDPFKEQCREVEQLLEFAIALPGRHVMQKKQDLLKEAGEAMQVALKEQDIFSKSRLPFHLRLARFALFFPAFRNRVMDEELDTFTIDQVHRNICTSLVDFDANYLHPIASSNHTEKKLVVAERTEREVAGLFTRLGRADRFLWPVFQREEASQARSEHNHDGYCIKGDKKIPVQIKESKSGSGGYRRVVIIRHYDILRAMAREREVVTQRWDPDPTHADYVWPPDYAYTQIEQGRRPDPIGRMLIDEMYMGKSLERSRRNALNLASTYVLTRVDEFSKTHIAK